MTGGSVRKEITLMVAPQSHRSGSPPARRLPQPATCMWTLSDRSGLYSIEWNSCRPAGEVRP
jgi:hypothetical protein